MGTRQLCKSKTSWQQNTVSKPVTPVKSAVFMKKLVAMSISHVIYLRGLMPENAFEDREMDGVPVKIITEKTNFQPAAQIVEWLKGAFEAFDRKYLEKLEFIFFLDEETPNILECYSFTFSYSDGQVTVDCESGVDQSSVKLRMEEIRLSTVQLLRHTSLLMQSMKKVTGRVSMRVRLYYYDEVTPDDYEPPGFEKAPDAEYVFQDSPFKFRHGNVNTTFHTVKFNSKICKTRFKENATLLPDQEQMESSQNQIVSNAMSQLEMMDYASSSQARSTPRTRNANENYDLNIHGNEVNMEERPEGSQETGFVKETPTDVQHAGVRCACAVAEDEGLLVFCDFCRQWNHAVCYRLNDEKTVPSSFCCIFCHNTAPRAVCNDATLIPLSDEHRKMICLYRRALMLGLTAWRIDKKILANELSVTDAVADKLLLFMNADKVFFSRKRNKGSYLHINSAALRDQVLPKYFRDGHVNFPNIQGVALDIAHEGLDVIKPKQRKVNQSIDIVEIEPRTSFRTVSRQH